MINQVVLENGLSEPAAKLGLPTVDVDRLRLSTSDYQSLLLQATGLVKPKLLLEPSSSLSVLAIIINDHQRYLRRSSKSHTFPISPVVLQSVRHTMVPIDQHTLLSIIMVIPVNLIHRAILLDTITFPSSITLILTLIQ